MAAETRILSKEEQDKIHELCLEAEVLVELAGSVSGLIFRNYRCRKVEMPDNISEIYDKSIKYTQKILKMQTIEELNQVSDELIGYRQTVEKDILSTFGKIR